MKTALFKSLLSLFLALFTTGFFLCESVSAQKKKNRSDSIRKEQIRRDSILNSLKKTDTSLNSLLQRIEIYTDEFNELDNTMDKGIDTAQISRALPMIEKRILSIKQSLVINEKTVTLRYLYTVRDLTTRLNEVLEKWQLQLEKYNGTMVQTQGRLEKILRDTSLQKLPADSSLRVQFKVQVNSLYAKLGHLDSANSNGLRRVGMLQNRISQSMITMAEYRQQIDDNLLDFGYRTLTQEFPVLFFDKKSDYPSTFRASIKQTILLDAQTLQYYIKFNVPTHLFILLVFIGFFWWIKSNQQSISDQRNEGEHVFDQVTFLKRSPVFPALLISTTLALFVYDHPPVPFTYIFVAVQVIATACIIPFVWNKRFVRFWIGVTTLFFFYAISNMLLEVSRNERMMLFCLSIIGAVTGALFLRDAKQKPQIYLPKTRPIFIAYTVLQSLAVLLNFFGRLSLAKIFGLTGIFMLWQAILLYLFVQILLEAIYLALEKGKNKSRFASYIDFKALQERSRSIISLAAILLWFILQAQNFNIADTVYEVLGRWLGNEHKLGSVSFTFGGLVIFGLIIWLSIAITRLINYFFDFADQKHDDGRSKYRSSMLLVRIGIFTVGFLLAVTASGFPLDKITIVIGALGVGIGLGLQDLVRNLVSGIVIAFEKPMQIGDVIEVEKRKGVVREIGIRASKIAMYEGAEIVVPNGILLSQNLTNWTLSSKARRVELPVSVAYGTDLEKARQELQNSLLNKEHMMENPGPFVTMQGFGSGSVDFKVYFWVANPDYESAVRAEVMMDIYKRFNEGEISMPFSSQDVYVRFPDGKPDEEKSNSQPQ